jgi:transcriptional regulator with XRE-family HTH domain
MNTERKSKAMRFLESLTGGPLTVSELLLSLRLSDDLSQEKFAKRLGISKQHLCDIEKGRKVVSPGRAAVFATRLKQPPAFFIQLALQEELKRVGVRIKVKVATS